MTDTSKIVLTAAARQAVRDAIRNHPHDGRLRTVLAGRKINDLNKEDLLETARVLDIDAAYIASGGPVATTPQVQAEPVVTAEPGQDIAKEADTFRRTLSSAMLEGDFKAVTLQIEALITEARKPARTIIVRSDDPAAAVSPAPIGSDTWGNLFNVTGAMAARKAHIYAPHPSTPAIDDKYIWPEHVTPAALTAGGRGRHLWVYGPKGSGKSTFAEQLAARTGRPFTLIACDDTTEAPELLGMTVPHDGKVRWQDGVLTAAIRVPNTLILIDEITVARPGAIMVLQSILASGFLSIKETGETVRVAEGVRFIVADNTNGTGGGDAAGYAGTRRLNAATLDRFSRFLELGYMDAANETKALVSHSGCTVQLATLLVGCAALSRKARVTQAIGLRRLIAWAEALTDGLDIRYAFECSVANACGHADREPIEQACALGLDKLAVTRALTGKASPATPAPTAPLSKAAADFAA